ASEMPQQQEQALLDSSGRTSLRAEEIRPNYLRKGSLRANVTSKLSDKSTLNVSTGYVSSRLRLPQNDNDVLGIISSGYTGGGRGTDSTEFPTWGFFPPRLPFQTLATQDVEEVVGLHDRLFFTGAVRIDRNSAVGKNLGSLVYPKAAVSWIVSDEPFFPQVSALSRLRLRAAYGASGLQPGVNDAIRYFQPVTAAADGGDQAGVNLVGGGVGNPDLKPERSTEIEAGIDAGLWNDRIGLELTYYHKKTKD